MDFDKPPDATTLLLIGLGAVVLLVLCCCITAIGAPFLGMWGNFRPGGR
jgi:hypothetical protein